jgi:hypothetical protein
MKMKKEMNNNMNIMKMRRVKKNKLKQCPSKLNSRLWRKMMMLLGKESDFDFIISNFKLLLIL